MNLNDTFTRFLYNTSAVKLANTYTRELHITGQWEDTITQRRLETILRNLPNLEVLHMRRFNLTITKREFIDPAIFCTTSLNTVALTSIVADYAQDEQPMLFQNVLANLRRIELVGVTNILIDPPASSLKELKVNVDDDDAGLGPMFVFKQISTQQSLSNLVHLDLGWIKTIRIASAIQTLSAHLNQRLTFLRIGYDQSLVNP